MIDPGGLHLPGPHDPAADAYKDWLHLNVFDHARGVTGLVNLSLHGPLSDARSRVVGTALFHHQRHGWVGNVVAGGHAVVGPWSIATEEMAIAVDNDTDSIVASVRLPGDGLSLDLTARAVDGPLRFEDRHPLGQGWISWLLVPRLRGGGRLVLAGETIDLDGVSVYHDHNWGRWRWGDDFGWEWGCFLSDGGPAVVFSRTTDRAHAAASPPTVHLVGLGRPRRFPAATVAPAGVYRGPLRRLPGAMAALHQDRRRPRLPATVGIEAVLGKDRVAVGFAAEAVTQVVVADPFVPGYSFIHESFGAGRLEGVVAGEPFSVEVRGVFEHVS